MLLKLLEHAFDVEMPNRVHLVLVGSGVDERDAVDSVPYEGNAKCRGRCPQRPARLKKQNLNRGARIDLKLKVVSISAMGVLKVTNCVNKKT
jgi:hypothetical protein